MILTYDKLEFHTDQPKSQEFLVYFLRPFHIWKFWGSTSLLSFLVCNYSGPFCFTQMEM